MYKRQAVAGAHRDAQGAVYVVDLTPVGECLTLVQPPSPLAEFGSIVDAACGDFDFDGNDELVMVGADGRVTVYGANGDPITSESWTQGVGDEVVSVTVGRASYDDMVLDESVDILVSLADEGSGVQLITSNADPNDPGQVDFTVSAPGVDEDGSNGPVGLMSSHVGIVNFEQGFGKDCQFEDLYSGLVGSGQPAGEGTYVANSRVGDGCGGFPGLDFLSLIHI